MTQSTASVELTNQAPGSAHQFCSLDMPQTATAAQADIYDIAGSSGIGQPPSYTTQFTHPAHDLSRGDYLNRPAALVIQPPLLDGWNASEAARRIYGVVTRFALLGSSQDESMYEIALESRLTLLRGTRRCRFFLDKSEPEIIRQILVEHEFNQIFASFEFTLYCSYRKHPFVMQWDEDDLAFITRLCRRTGIWFVCEAGRTCEHVRFCDDLSHYRRDLALTVAYREYNGLDSVGVESVSKLQMRAATVPKRQTVRTYHAERSTSEIVEASKDMRDDPGTYGETYVWGMPYLNEEEAKREALLRHEAVQAAQIEYLGTCNLLDLRPASVLQLSNRELPDAPHGLLVVHMACHASRQTAYRVEFTAIPADRLYRLPLMEAHWPRVEGVITGTIASPTDYVDPYLDAQGRYIVHLHADRDSRMPGLQSCPMRLAKPFAGPDQTGFHFGLVEGTVVTVGFLWGNPDLPYISQVLHTADNTDPIIAGYPWGTRNTIRTRSNNTLEMDDRQGREHIKLATEHGKTQLNLGHAVNRKNEERGTGFELRSDNRGHVRAGGGLHLTAYAQPRAMGSHTDMQPAMQQFDRLQARVQQLADSARASGAEVADLKAENQWLRNELDSLKQSVLALSAPGGIGMATTERVMVSAGKDVSLASAAQINLNALKRITLAAARKVSVFAQQGIKIFSAKGPVQIQSQGDLLSLAAQQDVTVSSVGGSVLVRAQKELTFECGGAYVQIKHGTITLGAVHGVLVKGPWRRWRPSQMHLAAPAFSPRMTPFVVGCEAWDGSSGRVAIATSPAPADGAVPAAPKAKKRSAPKPKPVDHAPIPKPKSEPPKVDDRKPTIPHDSPDADHDSESEPKNWTANDSSEPIKLDKPVYCDWHMPGFAKECTDATETPTYRALKGNKRPWIDDDGAQVMAGGAFPTAFELLYDERSKTLYATLRIKFVPVDLVKADGAGRPLLDADGKWQSIPYESNEHRDLVVAGVGKSRPGYALVYRDRTGPRFDVATKKQQAEHALNAHGCKLILDGCSRGGACGCRVSVVFKVEFLLALNDQDIEMDDGKTIHKMIHLFPRAQRADANAWGEVNMYPDDKDKWIDNPNDTNVVTHECGHLFNFPDEYWAFGGSVHQRYIRDQDLDFEAGNNNKGKLVWQIEAERNLMGAGANHVVQTDSRQPPSAVVSPYYLEYIRQHFCLLTHKIWRIGYES